MLSIFGQICRLNAGCNFLAKHAQHIYSSTSPSFKSFFWKIFDLCKMYQLKPPMQYLVEAPTKSQFKKNVSTSIKSYWHRKFLEESKELTSLKYFKVEFLPLADVIQYIAPVDPLPMRL